MIEKGFVSTLLGERLTLLILRGDLVWKVNVGNLNTRQLAQFCL